MTTQALQPGDAAPAFSLPTDGGGQFSLPAGAGTGLVLYFYPKDDTPGCTTEAQGFEQALSEFKAAGFQVVGVSKDTAKKHGSFKAKYGLSFPLVSDVEGGMVEAYGAWVEKTLYGRQYMGVDRSTFLIDGQGRIVRIWRKVKVPGHVAEVLAAAKAL